MKRVILVEPDIDNSENIIKLFNKFNPDSKFVNLHICLVFPFESDLETEKIESIFKNVLSKYNSLSVKLQGLTICHERNDNYLFLNVDDKQNMLKQMSQELYDILGDKADLKGEYYPHITIGKSKSFDEIQKMYKFASELLREDYNATITTVYSKKFTSNLTNIMLENEIEYVLFPSNNHHL